MRYTDSTQLPYPRRQVFDLVADIEQYPEFLPGWTMHLEAPSRGVARELWHKERQQLSIPQSFEETPTSTDALRNTDVNPTISRSSPASPSWLARQRSMPKTLPVSWMNW